MAERNYDQMMGEIGIMFLLLYVILCIAVVIKKVNSLFVLLGYRKP